MPQESRFDSHAVPNGFLPCPKTFCFRLNVDRRSGVESVSSVFFVVALGIFIAETELFLALEPRARDIPRNIGCRNVLFG